MEDGGGEEDVPDAAHDEGIENEADEQRSSDEPIPVHLFGIGLELWRSVEEKEKPNEPVHVHSTIQHARMGGKCTRKNEHEMKRETHTGKVATHAPSS
jgi:hypothetical protein